MFNSRVSLFEIDKVQQHWKKIDDKRRHKKTGTVLWKINVSRKQSKDAQEKMIMTIKKTSFLTLLS